MTASCSTRKPCLYTSCKIFELEGKAKQGELEIAITIYGAKLDSKINHVTWGFKIHRQRQSLSNHRYAHI
jgi:hypothetical protein